MKHKLDLILAVLLSVSAVGCVAVCYIDIVLLLYVTVIPFFCAQLLLCRLTGRWWSRMLPSLPVAGVLVMAGYYLIRDSGWDRLAALIFGLVSIAPAVGIVLAWVVWFLSRRYANK